MSDVTEAEYDNLGGYDNESMEVLQKLWVEAKRRRPLHDVIRAELPQLEAFVRGGESSTRFPKSAAAIERIIAAWRAAEPQ